MRLRSKPELAGLVALAYGPFLLSSPGQVSADSKQELYLDPAALLGRTVSSWDPHVGAGGVPHQQLGYLFPTGPWFWVFDRVGVPDWVAQRLWWGTLSLVAALGARWLFDRLGLGRGAALLGALVYVLSPYQLAFTARLSVLLLPWALLPWAVGMVMLATRSRGWRAPALAAAVLFLAGGINASSLVLVAIGPALWVLLECLQDRERARRALAASARMAVLGVGVSLWWIVGLRIQAAYGLPVLQLTENVRTVAEASSPTDVLRGLGNWFFYGRDRVGYSLDQAADLAGRSDLVVVASLVVPGAALAAATLLRWRHLRYFVLLVVVGTVVSVGSWPPDEPTPFGALWRSFTGETSVGLALRNSPRAVPVVVLGLAGLIAAGFAALPPSWWRRGAGAALVTAALLTLLPVARHGYLTDGHQRAEDLPRYWLEAAAAMDAGRRDTRVLEVPGVSFAAYRWGTTVDPVTPGLIARPYLAREVLPQGTAGTADLLDALDRRMQQGLLEPAMVAPIARLLAAGTVVLRGDLEQAGRFDTPPPSAVWRALGSAPGLGAARTFGPEIGDGAGGAAPAVALFEVGRARPIVRTAPSRGTVLLAGDGDGLVDAAAAGLLDGRALVRPTATMDAEDVAAALDASAHLVVTDSYRRRSQTWFFGLRGTRGPTERSGVSAPDPTGYDFRLDPYPGASDDARTVVEQQGGRVEANREGGPERPWDRAAHAVDGDPTTAWRVAAGSAPGATLVVVPGAPTTAPVVRLRQPPEATEATSVTRVRLTVNAATPIEVRLDDRSWTGEGQSVPLPVTVVQALQVEILEVSPGAAASGSPVGLAEVAVGDLRIAEAVRPPVDLLTTVGDRLRHHALDVVLTRLRGSTPGASEADEPALLRRIQLPVARAFALSGTARALPDAPSRDESTCHTDLLRVDGEAVPVRLTAGADGTLDVAACGPLQLTPGSHLIEATRGAQTGVDVDRILLSTDAGGQPARLAVRGAPAGSAPPVTLRTERATRLEATVRSDGTPFWLVLAQSASPGWALDAGSAKVGTRTLVDGYANGWLITPAGPGPLEVTLRWTPQRQVWWGLALSGAALLAVAAILVRTRRRPWSTVDLAAQSALRLPSGAGASLPRVLGTAALSTAVALVVMQPTIAAIGALALVMAWSVPRGRWLLTVLAPAALLVSRVSQRPSIAWLSIMVVAATVLAGDLSQWRPRRAGGRA